MKSDTEPLKAHEHTVLNNLMFWKINARKGLDSSFLEEATRRPGCRAIREMLAYGLKDPYTRFITPPEFEAMRKYDVTGVGLNLATAEEFTRKSGMQLPEDRKDAEVDVSRSSIPCCVLIKRGMQLVTPCACACLSDL